MHPSQFITAAITGALTSLAIAAFAKQPEIPEVPTVHNVIKTEIVYTCDNLPEYDSEENGAIRELRATCQATEEALLLIEQWQNNPQANIVYE